jgi:hypothetical protein
VAVVTKDRAERSRKRRTEHFCCHETLIAGKHDGLMSTTLRDLRDDEEEEENQEEGEGEGEESEDDDYVPPENEEDDSAEEQDDAYDEDIVEVGGVSASRAVGSAKSGAKAAKGAGTKRAASAKGAAKKGGSKRPRKGGIVDEDEEEAATASTSTTTEAPNTAAAEESPAIPAPAPATSKVDELWAELQSTQSSAVAAVPKPKPSVSSGSGLDVKALLAKTSGALSSYTKDDRLVEIQQKVDFCGEEVLVTKRVKVGSKEEVAYRQGGAGSAQGPAAAAAVAGVSAAKAASLGVGVVAAAAASAAAGKAVASTKDLVASALAASADLKRQMLGAPTAGVPAPSTGVPSTSLAGALRFDSSLEFKAALPAPKLPALAAAKPTGLQGLLASIDGKKKLSTMEKSRHDWGQAKEKLDVHTRDEMERFAKDGYLAKQEFLARTDQRQAEVARSNRRKGMGLKD